MDHPLPCSGMALHSSHVPNSPMNNDASEYKTCLVLLRSPVQ